MPPINFEVEVTKDEVDDTGLHWADADRDLTALAPKYHEFPDQGEEVTVIDENGGRGVGFIRRIDTDRSGVMLGVSVVRSSLEWDEPATAQAGRASVETILGYAVAALAVAVAMLGVFTAVANAGPGHGECSTNGRYTWNQHKPYTDTLTVNIGGQDVTIPRGVIVDEGKPNERKSFNLVAEPGLATIPQAEHSPCLPTPTETETTPSTTTTTPTTTTTTSATTSPSTSPSTSSTTTQPSTPSSTSSTGRPTQPQQPTLTHSPSRTTTPSSTPTRLQPLPRTPHSQSQTRSAVSTITTPSTGRTVAASTSLANTGSEFGDAVKASVLLLAGGGGLIGVALVARRRKGKHQG